MKGTDIREISSVEGGIVIIIKRASRNCLAFGERSFHDDIRVYRELKDGVE